MARKQKLKVYRTPIGFHDAYVAAPSQKAALAAWGSDADLFARGVAEVVTDAELTREPMKSPGKVIKRLRGSAEEHLAAVAVDRPQNTPAKRSSRKSNASPNEEKALATNRTKAKPKPKPKPLPSRAALERAEQRLATLTSRQQKEEEALAKRERALERERGDLDRKHKRDLRAAEHEVDQERDAHADAIRRWVERET